MFRGTVERDGEEMLQTRSPRLAVVIADLLNGEPVERIEVADQSPIPRYTVTHGLPSGWAAALWSESTARNSSPFGYGVVARAHDPAPLGLVATMLNEINPNRRPPVVRGFGWW